MKFCVIGLGRFGYQVATGLAEHGMEVLAVDSHEAIVASIRDYVTHAVCMRVTDEASLRSIGVDEMDTVIVATGENFAQSVLITALLKKRLNTQRVIARAINDIHQEILSLLGADEMILPEKEIGIRLADRLSSPFTDAYTIDEGVRVLKQEVMPIVFQMYEDDGEEIPEPIDESKFKGNIAYRTNPRRHYFIAREAQKRKQSLSQIIDSFIDASQDLLKKK